MDWFLYDRSLCHERVNSVQVSIGPHIKNSHLICTAIKTATGGVL